MKLDVTISRTFTINTGNYESIKPMVSVTAKEVDATKLDAAYSALDDVVTNLMRFETVNMYDEHSAIKERGLEKYCKTITGNNERLGGKIEEGMKALEDLT